MTYEIIARRVSVTLRWKEDRPRFKGDYAARPAEWVHITAKATLPIVPEDVRIEGRGLYIKKDGTTGSQGAEMRFGRLDTIPEPHKSQILAELLTVTA